MNASRRYVLTLAIIGSVVVLPAIVARVAGAPIGVLAFIGLVQYLVCVLLLLTSPVSLGFTVWALVKKDGMGARVYSIGVVVPWLAWAILFVTNRDGIEAAMSV